MPMDSCGIPPIPRYQDFKTCAQCSRILAKNCWDLLHDSVGFIRILEIFSGDFIRYFIDRSDLLSFSFYIFLFLLFLFWVSFSRFISFIFFFSFVSFSSFFFQSVCFLQINCWWLVDLGNLARHGRILEILATRPHSSGLQRVIVTGTGTTCDQRRRRRRKRRRERRRGSMDVFFTWSSLRASQRSS